MNMEISSFGKDIEIVAKKCHQFSNTFHQLRFWNMEKPNSELVLDTKLMALYPIGDEYVVYTQPGDHDYQELVKKQTRDIKGFEFEVPTEEEIKSSFSKTWENPYIDSGSGRIRLFPAQGEAYEYIDVIAIENISGKLWEKIRDEGDCSYALIPICRLALSENEETDNQLENLLRVCLKYGLVPEKMPYDAKVKLKELVSRYKK